MNILESARVRRTYIDSQILTIEINIENDGELAYGELTQELKENIEHLIKLSYVEIERRKDVKPLNVEYIVYCGNFHIANIIFGWKWDSGGVFVRWDEFRTGQNDYLIKEKNWQFYFVDNPQNNKKLEANAVENFTPFTNYEPWRFSIKRAGYYDKVYKYRELAGSYYNTINDQKALNSTFEVNLYAMFLYKKLKGDMKDNGYVSLIVQDEYVTENWYIVEVQMCNMLSEVGFFVIWKDNKNMKIGRYKYPLQYVKSFLESAEEYYDI